jgi:hypothetical protein
MGIWASVLIDPVLLLLALLLLPVKLATFLKGRRFLNAAERIGVVCPHRIRRRVFAGLVPPSATVPETVPLVLISKVNTLVFLHVLMEGFALSTAKALEMETIRTSVPGKAGGLLIAFRGTLRILASAVGTLLDLVNRHPSRKWCDGVSDTKIQLFVNQVA